MSVLVIILLILEFFVYIFHLSMLILLVNKRHSTFKGAFYKIFITVLIADLFCYVCLLLSQKIPLIPTMMPFFKSESSRWIAYIVYFIIPFVTGLQFIGHTFMAFNRFTIIWFPLKHKNIWSKQWYIVAILLISFAMVAWRLHEPVAFAFSADNETVTISFLNPQYSYYNYIMSVVMLLSTTLITIILNILTFTKFCCYKTSTSMININEKNLLFVSLIILIAQLLRISLNVNRLVFPTNKELMEFYTLILPVLYDILAWSGSISLLVLSAATRREYKALYFCKRNSVQTISSEYKFSTINVHTFSHPRIT